MAGELADGLLGLERVGPGDLLPALGVDEETFVLEAGGVLVEDRVVGVDDL